MEDCRPGCDEADPRSDACAIREQGHDVPTVAGGANTRDIAHTLTTEIVVSKVGVPEMDGYELARLRILPSAESAPIPITDTASARPRNFRVRQGSADCWHCFSHIARRTDAPQKRHRRLTSRSRAWTAYAQSFCLSRFCRTNLTFQCLAWSTRPFRNQ